MGSTLRICGFKMWPFNDKMGTLEMLKDFSKPRFYPVTSPMWNAIATLEQFHHDATKTAIATKSTF